MSTEPKETTMTDKTIPDVTDEDRRLARKWAESMSPDINGSGTALSIARVILDAVPAPPRPTLADMTPAERRACRRMQCDVEGRSMRYVIANPHDKDGEVTLLDSDGGVDWVFPEYVTPRPDLPRWEWPGTEKPAPAPALPDGWRLADHKDHGRVIVTNPTPNRDGRVHFVIPSADPMGFDWLFCDHSELTYTDQEADQ